MVMVVEASSDQDYDRVHMMKILLTELLNSMQ